MRRVIILIGFFSIISCSDRSKKDHIASTNGIHIIIDNEKDNLLGILNQRDTLKILVEFSECGEWGGHSESILLKRDQNDKVKAQLIIDSVSCDNIVTLYDSVYKLEYSDLDDKTRKVIVKEEKTLNETDEKLISGLIIRLLDLYFKDGYLKEMDSFLIYKGSGSVLRVVNTNSSLDLTFWNQDNYANTYYGKVRDQIFKENKKNK